MSRRQYEELEERLERIIRDSENRLIRARRGTEDALKTYIAELYEKHGELTEEIMRKYNRMGAFEKFSQNEVSKLFTTYNGDIRTALRAAVVFNRSEMRRIISGAVGRELTAIQKAIDVTATVNEDMAGLNWVTRMGKHRADAIYNIQRRLKEGLSAGEGYGTIARKIAEYLETSENRAKTIVRTEAKRVHSSTQLKAVEIAERAGVKAEKIWRTSQDERVRTSHVAFETLEEYNKWIPTTEEFVTPLGSRGLMPGLLSGPESARDNIRCRCFVEFRFNSEG